MDAGTTFVIAALSAAGFVGASLLALGGSVLAAAARPYAIALAAGILLALAFGELFPEGLEAAGDRAVVGFVAGFALVSLIETFTAAHTHHAPGEHVQEHALTPFVIGLAVHNAADGVAIGTGEQLSAAAAGVLGLGVLVHQIPVGLSLAAVLAAEKASWAYVVRTAILLGLAIPLGAAITLAVPLPGEEAAGVLTSVGAGLLAYIGAGHLLPEIQAEHRGRLTGVVFVATLMVMTAAIFTVLGEG